ncbi:sugar phosphate isomerase/epimerase family protein [Tenggerimyces flavus]|uniref:Sugar phosphate isomerase/epimerase family protein n=1 Tax=Tenggerimyces flavus TaxID=1708749 RepID=A0ABV7YNK5_9ACTN|nr:TIM barrel protein [Tenggerimyces flavus]MBM7789349.1 sugar phosphate isomerase/epimerase [Tenggerimyces flavus]
MNTLAVSSYSVREHLGPIVFDFVDPQGKDVHFELPYPKLSRISEFPARARDTFGVDAIETVAFQFDGLDDPEIDAFEQALTSTNVKLLNIAIDVGDLLEADNDKRANDLRLIERWIERFVAMGSQFVRVNPGSPFSAHHGDQPPAHLVAALQELGTFANDRGARLLVENHGGPSSNPAWMRALLDAVGKDSLGLLLDLGNFDVLMGPMMAMFFGGETEQKDPGEVFAGIDLTTLYEGIEALADKAELVSLKTHHVGDDGSVGPVDLVRSLDILAKHGYQGALTVEYEGSGGDPWAKSARVLDVARAALEGREVEK